MWARNTLRIGTSVDNLIVWRVGHLALRLNPRDWHSEASLTEDFPARLRARRKRQGTRTERMPQSIATVLINSRCSPSTSTHKVSRSCLKNVAQSPHRDEHHRHCLVCSITCDFGRAVRSHPVCHPRNALHDMCFSTFRLRFSASVTWKRCTCCTTVVAQPRSDAFDATGSMFSRRRESACDATCGKLEMCRARVIILSSFVTSDAQHICNSVHVARGSCCCTRSRPNAN